MAKQKNDLPQVGVSTETTGNADSNQTNVTSTTDGTGASNSAPVGANESGGEISALPENAKTEDLQTETVPENAAANAAASASEDEFAGVREDQRPLHQHAKEEAERIGNSQVDGGKEYVGAGVHKGREIKDGVIDFSTPSARELAMQESAKNSASAASETSENSDAAEDQTAPAETKKAA